MKRLEFSPHAQARQLVEHGGDRIQRIEPRLSPGEKPRRRRPANAKIAAYETERNAAGVTINWRFQHSRCPIQIASPLSLPFQT